MEKQKNPDFALLTISVTFILLGILILASVSASISWEKTGNTFYFLNHQILFGLIPGIFLSIIVYRMDIKTLQKLSLPLFLINILFLILVFVPGLGSPVKGAYRWIFLGPISFQPSEFLKITFILYLAAWIGAKAQRKKKKESWQMHTDRAFTFFPFFLIFAVLGLFLALQPDISTLGIIGIIGIVIYFLASTPFYHTLLFLGLGISALMVLIKIAPYRLQRIAVFLDPMLDPLGKGYQIKQGLIGIGSGGLTGVGLGLSFQKFGMLPEPISDSIFAIFAEETGFIGATILLLLFLLFAWRGVIIAKRAQDSFSKLTAMGITTWICTQAFVNIGSMTGLLPLAGVPLPFISYGGSALIAELIGMGILLNISRRT